MSAARDKIIRDEGRVEGARYAVHAVRRWLTGGAAAIGAAYLMTYSLIFARKYADGDFEMDDLVWAVPGSLVLMIAALLYILTTRQSHSILEAEESRQM